MFESIKDYYPTPKSLIHKMLKDINWRDITTVLEPSAGSGHIVEEVLERLKASHYNSWSREKKKYDIDLIEINQELRYILQGKGFRVIHDDFLTYEGFKRYDLIVANFPFSEGDKHLNHALNMISQGGTLVALINSETIRNPYSNLRKDLIRKLNELNATIEYLQEEFVEAERSTNVEVALIKVTVENNKRESLIINNLKQEEQFREESKSHNNIIQGDFINGIIEQYNFEVKAGLKLINEYRNLQPLILQEFKDDRFSNSILHLELCNSKYDSNNDTLENGYIKKVRYKYWKALFSNEQFTSLLTSNLLNDYRQKIDELEDYDFSYYNIKEIQRQMSKNMKQGVEDTIFALFEEFTHKHSWYGEMSNNIHYFNGWCSNSAFKINKKIIIPLYAYSSITERLDYMYKFYEKIKDIERVFNYLDGGKTEELDLKEILMKAQNDKQVKNIKTKYFSISTFKKGTTHITFFNEDLLHKFNIFGANKKGWLPPTYGKKKYTDMTKEEQDVIDSFEGKESYNKTMDNLDYYLYNPSKILMLQG